ncbi:MAG: putative sigma-54 modulation protein [Candidatus Saganbacteria bacterium]|uniref:Putative sigma-54 modulation protein n=1 Tax=Candidatus Saganbacteria bacterium TaxID=2575572 RepID=A0A833NZZ0_UNCSA|nr:MAG: putative sigma-54 modulation protein [Candidatus Saganbacteria bacterium]
MQVNIQGHGIELTEPLRDYAFKKISKLKEFYGNIQKMQVILDSRSVDDQKRRHVCEVNIWAAGKNIIRASEAAQDMYSAIDLVFEELVSQVKKHKEKHIKETRREGEKIKKEMRTYVPTIDEAKGPKLVKLKRFNISAMTKDEAKLECDKLGHGFFMFRNAESAEINVLHDDHVIEPESAEEFSEDLAISKLMKDNMSFLAFKNQATNELNVLYKRKSGNLGLIEPTL